MVQGINLFKEGFGLSGGIGGFLNGNPLGRDDDKRPLSGLLNRGFGANNRNSAAGLINLPNSNPVLRQIEAQKKAEEAREKKDERAKGDSVELSDFVKDAADKAVENANKNGITPGTTNQVFVSEDGQFEVSVDLQIRGDGSYDLDLQVGFAKSQAFAVESFQQRAIPADETAPEGETADVTEAPEAGNHRSASVSARYQRYTSYEQTLSTRDFEARIFFEESKSVAAGIQQRHGSGAAGDYLGVAKEVSNEFKLNISISGADINNFNAVAEELSQFDDTGTLSGFLQAASGVLNSDSTDIGAFVDATRVLIDSAREHVSSKLSGFFNSFNDAYGSQLEELGFGKDYLANLGEDVQKDLDTFFAVTNDFLGKLTGNTELPSVEDTENQKLELLEENLEQLREAREEQIEKKALENQGKAPVGQQTSPERGNFNNLI